MNDPSETKEADLAQTRAGMIEMAVVRAQAMLPLTATVDQILRHARELEPEAFTRDTQA